MVRTMSTDDYDPRIVQALGAAAIRLWSDLPREIQEKVFEAAVALGHRGEQDENLREQMAKFLHDHHPRTAHPEGRDHHDSKDQYLNIETKELYTSANGDVWYIARDSQTGRVFVRHQANARSGAHTTDTDVREFLERPGESPEKQALVRMGGRYFD
jgi:hypothetical protein